MKSKDYKARVTKAFRAMKAIGIPADKVKPVLKELLELYNHNWKLIEEENYRALADTMFEREELECDHQEVEQSKKIENTQVQDPVEEEVQASQEPERPLKRLRNRTVAEISLVRPKGEPDKPPDTHLPKVNPSQSVAGSRQANENNSKMPSPEVASELLRKCNEKQIASPKSSTLQESCDPFQPKGTTGDQPNASLKNESRLPAHVMTLRDRGKGVVSPEIPSKNRRPGTQHSSSAICLKDLEENVHANTVLINPKDKPITNGMLLSNGKDKSSGGDSPSRYDVHRESLMQKPGEVHINSCNDFSSLEIASSPSREVRMFLSLDLAHGINGFHMPSHEAVIKSAEAKYLRLSKTLKSSISMSSLLKEICKSFLELGTDVNSQIPKALDVTQAIDSVNKSSASDAQGASGLNDSVDFLSGAQLKRKISHPCKDSTEAPQLSNMGTGDQILTNGESHSCAKDPKSVSSKVIQKSQLTPEISRPQNGIVDISKGEEKIVITVVNEVNNESPPSFCYIPQNATFQNAYLNFCLARIGDDSCCISCSGDCLSSSVSCACTSETGGDFAYTAEGLVKDEFLKTHISMNQDPKKHSLFFCKDCPLERSKGEDIIDPCKGHLVRKFIKECWRKCGCGKQCGNRVVQRGITRKLQVFMTPEGKGWGLRTLEDLPKGAFVCEYVGEVLTNSELFERVLRSSKGEKHSYPVLLDADWGAEGVLKDEEALCLDATYYGNVARFINHRCHDSTLVEIPVEIETPDHHYYHLAFFTTRNLKAMEELTWDYGIDFEDHGHPIKAFSCQCGSNFCRSKKRTTRSKRSRR